MPGVARSRRCPMDDQRFDRLTRTLATMPSRRRLLGATLGLGLAGLLGRSAPLVAAAPPCVGASCLTTADCCGGASCDPITLTCQPLAIPGGGECGPGSACTLDTDCCNGLVCAAGRCRRLPVTPGPGPCIRGGACGSDSECCTGEVCQAGACGPGGGPCTAGGTCTTEADCCGGEICCNARCSSATCLPNT